MSIQHLHQFDKIGKPIKLSHQNHQSVYIVNVMSLRAINQHQIYNEFTCKHLVVRIEIEAH